MAISQTGVVSTHPGAVELFFVFGGQKGISYEGHV